MITCEVCNEFNKFNNTEAPMLDSIYHITCLLNYLDTHFCENVEILPSFKQR